MPVMVLTHSKHAGKGKANFSWSRVVNDDGAGTQLMWRLADAVFFHMQSQTRAWHGIDASQFFWLLRTAAVEDDDTIDARVLNLGRCLDDAEIYYSTVMVNGQQVPTMDRISWYKLMCREAHLTPDYSHKWWTSLINELPLEDPETRRPFPCPPPRSAFPGAACDSTHDHEIALPTTWTKSRRGSKASQQESHEPNYMFLPRIKSNMSDSSDDKDKKNSTSRLHKLPQMFSGSDGSQTPDGWMRTLSRSLSRGDAPPDARRAASQSTTAFKRFSAPPSSFMSLRSAPSIKSLPGWRSRASSSTASITSLGHDVATPENEPLRSEDHDHRAVEVLHMKKPRRAPLLRRHSSDAIIVTASQSESVVVF